MENEKEQNLFETEIFCMIINVFAVNFEQCNKSINFLKKSYRPQTFEL